MSRHRYQTKAFVLGGISTGEANRFVDLFTEDLGRLYATARSVREERSKLRFSLQDFSLVDISLVRGKEVWRIVGAEADQNIHFTLRDNTEARDMMVRFILLLKRLLGGEEENRELFSVLKDALVFLTRTTLSKEERDNFECLVVLRILHNLGYLARDNHNARFLDAPDLNTDLIAHLSPLRLSMIKQINTSLEESQL